LQEKLINFV